MHSPLSISQISLSQSYGSEYTSHGHGGRNNGSLMFDVETPSASSATKDFLYQRQVAPNAVPVLVRLQRNRILWTALLGVALIVVVMVFLQQGIVLKSYAVSTEASTSGSSSNIDTFNFIAGLFTAALVKPLLALVSAVVPAVLLCFFTRLTMQEKKSRWTQISLTLVGTVVLWFLLNGFMAVHVSEELVREDVVIGDDDLYENNSVSVLTTGNTSSSADTFLRSAIKLPDATAEHAAGQCRRSSPRRLPAQLDYGFQSRLWFGTLLPYAPETTSTNTISVSMMADDNLESKDEVKVPMKLSTARDLVSYAMRATDDFLREQDVEADASVFNFFGLPDTFDVASSEDVGMTQLLIESFNNTMNRAVNTREHLRNLSIAESSVEFVQFPWSTDSGNLVFEGVTLDIPMTKNFLRRDVNFRNDTTHSVEYGSRVPSGLFEINAKEECGRFGCIVSPVGAALTTAPADEGSQVRALPICLDEHGNEDYKATMDVNSKECEHRSTTSMLVLSFAKRIVGDSIRSSLVGDSKDEALVVTLRNARKIYQVTAGRLSWKTMDLASKYGASCEASDCSGLVFPLSGSNQQVVVGKNYIPVNNLTSYTPSLLSWTPLVSANAQEVDMSDILKSDFVFPENFQDTSGWTPVDGFRCERERGVFLDRVQNLHLYSEQSLQPAYTSALFWLFQYGAVKQQLSPSELSFSESVKYVDVTLSVPPLSATFTFVGCVMLVLMAALVFLGGKSREAEIERYFKPHNLARILLDDEAFSHKLLKCDLLNVGDKYLNSSELLDQFEISGLALRHCKRPNDVLIVPKVRQSPTTSAALVQAAHVV
uniref:Transmembrane protein n=1 Tax=Peronospora matthiolae TaxID=2874970 RepID=A0AAV1T0Y0_9STRA